MKFFLLIFFFLLSLAAFSQFEITTGYAVNKNLADGIPVAVAYEYKIKKYFYAKSQIGYKYLHYYNNNVDATLKFSTLEFHETFSYEVVKRKRYIFKPNIGVNYRFYKATAEIAPPYNTLPQRAWIIGYRRDRYVRLNSYDGDGTKNDRYKTSNIGFTIQLQNQFRINDKIWLQITPFLESDYDRLQNTGGCYIGVVFKKL